MDVEETEELDDLEAAIRIALDAYEGQEDKAGATYIRHPLRVMEQMETRQERIVAVLHDVVEDSDYELYEIEARFGQEVRDAVDALTKREDGDEDYMAFVERAAKNPIAARVKLADIKDNMDLTRLDEVDDDLMDKQQEYHVAWQRLRTVVDGSP